MSSQVRATQDVPNEIHFRIFKHLKKNDLVNCALVCKTWSNPATQALHKKVYFNGRDVLFIQSKLLQQNQEQHPFSQRGHWMKSLGIWNDESESNVDLGDAQADKNSFCKQDFVTLVSYMPNLRKLDITSSSHAKHYLRILKKIDSKMNLQKIEDIAVEKINTTQKFNDLTFMARLNFCKSLTQLDLCLLANQKYTLESGESGDAFYFLPRFKNLTHLDLQNHQHQGLTAFQLLEMFPGLVSLRFQSNLTPNHVDEVASTGTEKKKMSAVKLKTLILSLSEVNSHYIAHITPYCSSQLEVFKIYMNACTFYDWIRKIGENVALDFAKALSKIKTVDIRFQPTQNQQPGQHVQLSQTAANQKATTFYRYLSALVEDRKVSNCSTVYYGGDMSQEIPFISIKDNGHLCFGHILDSHPDYGYKLPSPYKSVKVGPAIINNIKVFLERGRGMTANGSQILQNILENCPNMEELLLQCCTTHFKLRANNSIAIDDGCASKSDILSISSLTQQQKKKGRITKIHLSGAALTQPLINTLSTFQQNIKVFVCSAQVIGDDLDLETLADDPSLDLTGLQSLQNFTFSVKNIITGNFDHLFIHFIYHNENYSSDNNDEDDSNVKEEHYHYDIRELGTRSRPFACTKTTPLIIKQFREDISMKIKSITFNCNRIPEVVFFMGNSAAILLAEFRFGELLDNSSQIKYLPCPKFKVQNYM